MTGLVPLESVLRTDQLHQRPSRPADFASENRALSALVQALADSPRTILQKLTDTILEVLQAGSAGISVLSADQQAFEWPAISGAWQARIGGGTPRNFGPCGNVLDANSPLLFANPERRYPYLLAATAPIDECLMVPFSVAGRAAGTIWAIAHEGDRRARRFDAEDLRQLESLGRFASAACQAVSAQGAEDALLESEAFNRSVVDSSSDCIKVLDLAGNLLSFRCGLDLLGITDVQPYLQKSWIDFWQGDDRQAAAAAVATAAAGGVGTFVGFFRTLRAEPKWWDVTISPILNANLQPVQLLVVSRDVTEARRRALHLEFLGSVSQDLAQWTQISEMMQTVGAKLAAYLRLSKCAFADVDESGGTAVISHEWHRPGGLSLVGSYRLGEFLGDELASAARAGEVVVVRDTSTDPYTIREKFAALEIASFVLAPLVEDGQWRFALCLYHAEPYDWPDDEIALIRELTVRIWTRLEGLRATEVLRESEERYRTLFNSMDEGYCVIEVIFDAERQPIDFRYLEANPAFEKQAGLHGIVGKRIREVVPDLDEYWFDTYGKVATTGEPVRFLSEAKAMNRWFDFYAFRIGGAASDKVAVVFSDATERTNAGLHRQQQEAALVDLHHRKDEFLAMLSHELRSPLAPLANAAHLLSLQKHEDPLQRQARQIIERQVAQLKHLVDDLLEVSRITTGRILLRHEQTVVSGIVDRAVETADGIIAARRHLLTVSLPPDPVWVSVDAARIAQVVVNLLVNAAKYTDKGGRIWLSVRREGSGVVLAVRDTGMGIAPELLPGIFDLFTQGARSLDRSQGGLGVGLSLVRRLVELHGGTVTAHSIVGEGSEFIVHLPDVVIAEPPATGDAGGLLPLDSDRRQVLVVDDNVDTALSLASLLGESGYKVRTAHDGPTAIDAAVVQRPDFVILDIGLPGLNGYEVAARMRKLAVLSDVILIAMTGYGQEGDRKRAVEAGFDHHLVKPVDFDVVQRILSSVPVTR